MPLTRRAVLTGILAAPVAIPAIAATAAAPAPSWVLGVDVGLGSTVGVCLARRAGETVVYSHMPGWYNSYVAMMKAAAEAAIQREPYPGPRVAEIPHDDH